MNYKRWTESKQYMAAEEIDAIIRMQLAQLQTDNPFVDDFYYQNFIRKTGKPALADEVSSQAYHKPISEASPRPQKKYSNGADGSAPIRPSATSHSRSAELLAGSLGRVPSHSVRAPRPLVSIQREHESGDHSANPNDDNVRLLAHTLLTSAAVLPALCDALGAAVRGGRLQLPPRHRGLG